VKGRRGGKRAPTGYDETQLHQPLRPRSTAGVSKGRERIKVRTVIVTGASSGIGAEIARECAAEGWRVAIGARRLDRLKECAVSIEEAGGVVFAHPLDVSSPESIDAFFAAVEAEFGPVDALVNNAGFSVPGLLHEVDPHDLEHEITTNLLGPMWMARRGIPAMLAAKAGDLIFIGSDNADNPRPYQAGYSASKAGIKNLARVLEMELEGTGIRVTTLRLGPTTSEFGVAWTGEVVNRMLALWKHFGLQRNLQFMDPIVVAGAVVHALKTPRGATLASIELQPTPPLAE
jgi:NADP-dependent 3-hydroxy acid dehydrogenase YdfG